jgi:hypothetical protein
VLDRIDGSGVRVVLAEDGRRFAPKLMARELASFHADPGRRDADSESIAEHFGGYEYTPVARSRSIGLSQ